MNTFFSRHATLKLETMIQQKVGNYGLLDLLLMFSIPYRSINWCRDFRKETMSHQICSLLSEAPR